MAGRRLTAAMCLSSIKPLLKKQCPFIVSCLYVSATQAGISVGKNVSHGLHILRHTLASELVRQGEAYSTVSAILGHSGIGSTDAYTHIDLDGLLKCALELQEVTAHE